MTFERSPDDLQLEAIPNARLAPAAESYKQMVEDVLKALPKVVVPPEYPISVLSSVSKEETLYSHASFDPDNWVKMPLWHVINTEDGVKLFNTAASLASSGIYDLPFGIHMAAKAPPSLPGVRVHVFARNKSVAGLQPGALLWNGVLGISYSGKIWCYAECVSPGVFAALTEHKEKLRQGILTSLVSCLDQTRQWQLREEKEQLLLAEQAFGAHQWDL